MACQGLDGLWNGIRMTCMPEDFWILSMVLATFGAGGNTYTKPKLSQEIDRASTAHAVSSRKCDTKMGDTLLAAVVIMSTRGFPKTQNRLFKVSYGSRHSVGLRLFVLDNASAVMLRDPGRWVWVRLMCWRSNRFNSSTVLVNSPGSGAPFFRIYATVMLWSEYMQSVWPCHWEPQWRTASLTASISNQFMWNPWRFVVQDPVMWESFLLAPHPVREAFVKKNRSGSGFCRGTSRVILE